jgi:hypothetical protein
MVEYLVIFFLVIGAIVAMTTFIQRTLQGRIRDGRNYMIREAAKAHGNAIHYEYEPYYGYTGSNVIRKTDDSTRLFEGGGTGIASKTLNQTVISNTISQQAPPKDAL